MNNMFGNQTNMLQSLMSMLGRQPSGFNQNFNAGQNYGFGGQNFNPGGQAFNQGYNPNYNTGANPAFSNFGNQFNPGYQNYNTGLNQNYSNLPAVNPNSNAVAQTIYNYMRNMIGRFVAMAVNWEPEATVQIVRSLFAYATGQFKPICDSSQNAVLIAVAEGLIQGLTDVSQNYGIPLN